MKNIRTILTETLGIKYPILGAPMFKVSYGELTAAVSMAGGLGCLPLPNFASVEKLKAELQKIKGITNAPIGVNIHLSGKFPWKEQLAVCLDHGVSFFITALGDPALITKDVHAGGGKVATGVISLEQGKKAGEKGVDFLVAVGSGAGGHGGVTPTMVLVPYLIKETGLPVIAAGGIASGGQMAAAMALGACGVNVGTRLLAAHEAGTSPEYRDAVIRSGPGDIVFTDRITGNRANWIEESIRDIKDKPEISSPRWAGIWSAGKSVAQTSKVMPAGSIIREMVGDYAKTVRKLSETTD